MKEIISKEIFELINSNPKNDTELVQKMILIRSLIENNFEPEFNRCCRELLKTDSIKHKSNAYNELGNFELYKENYEKALECFNEAINIDENDAIFYHGKALSLRRLNRCEDALRAINKGIELNKNERYNDGFDIMKKEILRALGRNE